MNNEKLLCGAFRLRIFFIGKTDHLPLAQWARVLLLFRNEENFPSFWKEGWHEVTGW
jgi:hypothetical protein